MLLRAFRMRRARPLHAAIVFSLLMVAIWYHHVDRPPSRKIRRGALPLPLEYRAEAQDARESGFCRDRFGPKFLQDLRSHSIAYCSPGSRSALTCFHTQNHPDGRVDSLCIGQHATLNAGAGRFQLGCQVRTPRDNETAAGLIRLGRLSSYWYDTGPGVIFREYVDMTATTTPSADAVPTGDVVVAADGRAPPRYTLLLKREGEGNLWHCLMEIMTMTLTFDVLRMARATPTDPPFFTVPDSVPDTQVVILDDRPDGPYFDLWRLFSGRAPVRLRDVLRDPTTARAWAATPQNLVVPLAGAANPLWQNDWTERDCRAAPLLRVFVQRVLAHYGVTGAAASSSSSSSSPAAGDEAWTLPEGGGGEGGQEGEEEGKDKDKEARGGGRRLRVTLIDRAATRRLADEASLLQALRKRFPGEVTVEAVDFAALNFTEQLRAARATDVLVGVHGAGLTHALFMRPGAGAVVEIEPPTLDYKGFRNLARMRGLHHFFLHGATTDLAAPPAPASPRSPGDDDDKVTRPKTLPPLRWQPGGDGGGGGADDDDTRPKTPPPGRRSSARRDWHSEDLMVGEQAFVDVVGEAIAALRRRRPGT